MVNKITFTAILVIFGAIGILAQNPPTAPTPMTTDGTVKELPGNSQISLDMILTEAQKQTAKYREAFKDLIAVETKSFEEYDKNEEVKNESVIESNFLVYQSSKDEKISSELRNVTKVDGKLIPNSAENSDKFFAELQKSSTLASELEKIQKVGSKYDKTLEISGLTLFEGVILSDNLRSSFDFKLDGEENYQGSDVYIVSYQQTKKSPFISLNQKGDQTNEIILDFKLNIPGALKNSDAFINGKLWIDKQTFQIKREERKLVVQAAEPLTVLESTFEYQPSEYEILVPKQILVLTNQIKKKDDKFFVSKDTKVNFEYSQFKKSNVEVKILDDK